MDNKAIMEVLKYFSLLTFVGLQISICVLAGYYIGFYLQNLTGSLIFMITPLIGGVIAGFTSVYYTIMKILK
ncbi:AtpZ/AtpI family protein [Proteinivorax hydrogeniformans]|uniref:AtpZ/AtpI family protein n=1 Tax=Proteinivorax hydrogeniformans TaxID=1826727 RepID=A0AAU8HSS9_9FIRM